MHLVRESAEGEAEEVEEVAQIDLELN